MELEFDKEIDAILRGTRMDDVAASGSHIDADAAALFAENLLPDAARKQYLSHFAECSRCRKLLSGIVELSAEDTVEPTAVAASAAQAAAPWYGKLFVMPNLAYVMGGLILLFGGFFALQVLQNKGGESAVFDVSKVSEQEPVASGPNLGIDEPQGYSNSTANAAGPNQAANASSNTAVLFANSNASAATSSTTASNRPVSPAEAPRAERAEEEKKLQVDGVSAADKPAAAAAVPPAASQPIAKEKLADDKRDVSVGGRVQDEIAATVAPKNRAGDLQSKDELRPGGPTKSAAAGPSREMQRQFPNTLSQRNQAAATRRVGGKTFEYNDRVWYDTAYRGGRTINVRRGTGEFQKLDDGLRSIANAISGTLVVVWKEKSYRID